MKTNTEMKKEFIKIVKEIFTEDESWSLISDLYLYSHYELVQLLVVSNPNRLDELEAFKIVENCKELQEVLHDTVLEVICGCDFKRCLLKAFENLMKKGTEEFTFSHDIPKKTSLS